MLGLWNRSQWNSFANSLDAFFGRVVLRSHPWFVQMESTSRCNLRCIQCSRQKLFGKGEDIDLEVLDRVERELLPWAREFCASFYGEPLLCPHFDRVLDAIERHPHLRSGFFTHGLLLTEKRIDRILEAGVSYIYISIDGATRETYESVRQGASFDRLIENLETLSRKRREWEKRGGHRLKVQIRVVGMRQNIEEAPLFVEMAHRHDFDAVGYYVNMTVDDEAMIPSALNRFPELANRMFRLAHRRAKELHVITNFGTVPFPQDETTSGVIKAGRRLLRIIIWPWTALCTAYFLTGGSVLLTFALLFVKGIGKILRRPWGRLRPFPNTFPKEHCGTPWAFVIVKANGEIQPCCFLSRPMGSLKMQHFMDIWNGPDYLSLRRSIVEQQYWTDCQRGGCNYIAGEETLKYGYEWVEVPISLSAQAGEDARAKILVRNTGTMTWETPANDPTHYVTLGYHVLDSEGHILADLGHTPASEPTPPGQTAAFDLTLPTRLEPGEYALRIDVIHEAITWFRDRGQKPHIVTFHLHPPLPDSSHSQNL